MPLCDHDLMERVRQRDEAAFDALTARYRDALYRHLASIVRETGAAEDLLQEVFLRVWTRADQWDGHGAARAWLFRIATNLALNYLRSLRRRRERPLEVPTASFSGEDLPVPAWMVDAAAARPEQQVVWEDQSRRLRLLIGALPAAKREVLRLACEEGLDLQEVAERLDIPEGTAKSRLHHARRWLAREWIASEREGEDRQ